MVVSVQAVPKTKESNNSSGRSAEEWRQKGNDHFKSEDYVNAHLAYTL